MSYPRCLMGSYHCVFAWNGMGLQENWLRTHIHARTHARANNRHGLHLISGLEKFIYDQNKFVKPACMLHWHHWWRTLTWKIRRDSRLCHFAGLYKPDRVRASIYSSCNCAMKCEYFSIHISMDHFWKRHYNDFSRCNAQIALGVFTVVFFTLKNLIWATDN